MSMKGRYYVGLTPDGKRNPQTRSDDEMARMLDARRISLILAGLRVLQNHLNGKPERNDDAIQMILLNEGYELPSTGEIDALCEELNTSDIDSELRQELLVKSVYGNLGIERPSLKIEEVRKILSENRADED